MIVLATDGSPDAAAAGRAAAWTAAALGARVHAVHAWNDNLGGYAALDAVLPPVAALEQAAGAAAAADVDALRALGVADAEEHLVRGGPVEAILAVAGEVDAVLIVVGHHRGGAIRRALLGSVSEAVAHRAHRPVLVVPGGSGPWPPTGVVAAFDGTGEACRAARLGAEIAAAAGCGLLLLHAVEPDGGRRRSDHRLTFGDAVDELSGRLERHALRLGEIAGGRVECRVLGGDPATAVLEAAAGGRLIVMGSHGRGLTGRLVGGSVSTRVLHAAPGPVLIVPAEPRSAEGPQPPPDGDA